MNSRRRIPNSVALQILAASRRRCCICFGLRHDAVEKKGQIAHLDRDRTNSAAENLAFLCLEHHDQYDTRPSQARRFSIDEVKHYRDQLVEFVQTRIAVPPVHTMDHPGAPAVPLDESSESDTKQMNVAQATIPTAPTPDRLLDKALGTAYLEQSLSYIHDEYDPVPLAFAILDVDDLTVINKQYGIEVGNAVLQTVARIIRGTVPSNHAVGRCGDDTFFVVFRRLAEAKAKHLCELLARKFTKFKWAKIAHGLRVTCSIGVAEGRFGEPARDSVIRAAIGMLNAKRGRGGKYVQVGPYFLKPTHSREFRHYWS